MLICICVDLVIPFTCEKSPLYGETTAIMEARQGPTGPPRAVKKYINDLIMSPSTAIKTNKIWRYNNNKERLNKNFELYSIGAYCYKNKSEFESALKKELDISFAFEFNSNAKTILHIKTLKELAPIIDIVCNIIKSTSWGVEIKIH